MAEQIIKLFSRDIQKNLFPNNEFYKNSKLDGGIDINAATVQVPQSGSKPTINVNPSSFPLTISERTDDVKEYAVDFFAGNPTEIKHLNEAIINYDKRQDILSDFTMSLNSIVGDNMAHKWGNTVADSKILTTGSARTASVSGGADKKALTYEDIVRMSEILDIQDIPSFGRKLLVSPQMYSDLLKINEFISMDFRNNDTVSNGAIGTILGFDVFKRSKTLFYDGSLAKKAFGAASAATDKDSAIAWHPSFVRRAEGTVKVFSTIDDPTLLASVYNAAVRNGGTISRNDEKGVVTLVQDEA